MARGGGWAVGGRFGRALDKNGPSHKLHGNFALGGNTLAAGGGFGGSPTVEYHENRPVFGSLWSCLRRSPSSSLFVKPRSSSLRSVTSVTSSTKAVASRVTLVVDHGSCVSALLHLCPDAAAVLRVGGLLMRDGRASAVLLGPAAQVRLCDGRPNSRALAARSQLGSPDLFFSPAAMTSARRHSPNSGASSARCSAAAARCFSVRLASLALSCLHFAALALIAARE